MILLGGEYNLEGDYKWIHDLGALVIRKIETKIKEAKQPEQVEKAEDFNLLYLCMLPILRFSVKKVESTVEFLKKHGLLSSEMRRINRNKTILHVIMALKMSNSKRTRCLELLLKTELFPPELLLHDHAGKNVFQTAFFKLNFEPIRLILSQKQNCEKFFEFLGYSRNNSNDGGEDSNYAIRIRIHDENCRKYLYNESLLFKACKTASFDNIKWACDCLKGFKPLLRAELCRAYPSSSAVSTHHTALTRLLETCRNEELNDDLLKSVEFLIDQGFPNEMLYGPNIVNCLDIITKSIDDQEPNWQEVYDFLMQSPERQVALSGGDALIQ